MSELMNVEHDSTVSIAGGIRPASSMKANGMATGSGRYELSNEHAALLEDKRKIPAEIASQLGIVSNGNAIGFTYRQTGVLKWTKWRGPGKKFWIEPAGARLFPWNLDCLETATSGDTLVITEGEFDCASAITAGFTHSVSVPNGAVARATVADGDIVPQMDSAFSYLWTENGGLLPGLGRTGKVILAVDSDAPGKNLAAELAIRLGPDRCFIANFPAGCKDPNDVLVKHGVEALRSALETARALVPDKLIPWHELPVTERPLGLATGWRSLDPHLKLTFPELIIVTGRPGAGKSRWTLSWVMNLARLHGVRTAYVSLEDGADRMRRHTLTYARTWEGKDITTADGEVITPIETGQVAEWLDLHMRFVSPSVADEDTRDLDWLKRIVWEAACRHDCKIVVLDPFNELEAMFQKGRSDVDYLNEAVREFKRWGRRYGIAIIIIAHPDKNAGRNESIDEMTLYSISGGAVWKNKADGGIIIGQEINSDGATGNTIVKCDKRKDWDVMGIPGQVTLAFDSVRGIYTSVG